MDKLKPCPFCGNTMEHYTISFKRDRRKVMGVYHEICTLKCPGCTCTIQQAGWSREKAEENAISVWNRRANDA